VITRRGSPRHRGPIPPPNIEDQSGWDRRAGSRVGLDQVWPIVVARVAAVLFARFGQPLAPQQLGRVGSVTSTGVDFRPPARMPHEQLHASPVVADRSLLSLFESSCRCQSAVEEVVARVRRRDDRCLVAQAFQLAPELRRDKRPTAPCRRWPVLVVSVPPDGVNMPPLAP